MESLENPDQDLQELSFRVNRLRVSLRMKRRSRIGSNTESGDNSPAPNSPAADSSETNRFTLQVPLGPESGSSVTSSSSFRSRLSSHSSVCSNDSGFVSVRSRSRLGSEGSALASKRPGSILNKIAKSQESSKNADSEFLYYRRPRSSVNRSGSTASSVSVSSTGSRNRSFSLSSTTNGDISISSASNDYAEVYSMCDPFDEEESSSSSPPPLPPRRARLRPPALPPYPSTAVRLVNNISESILC